MSRILLVFPEVECGYGVPKYPPLGLAYLAAVLNKKGHEVFVLDERMSDDVLDDVIKQFGPSHIGFYASVLTAPAVKTYLKKFKSSGVKLFVGGPEASISPEDFVDADHVIVGEGETSILKMLNGSSERILCEHPYMSLDSIPFPAWHYFGRTHLTLPLMTSRGCPFSCIFCGSYKVFGKKYRKRSVKNIILELQRNKNQYGMIHFEIIDDLFTLDKQFVKSFCNSIKPLNLSWDCVQGVRIDTLDEEALMLMRESGCRMIGVGIESGDQGVVDAIGKCLDLKKAEKNIRLAKKHGLTVKAFFVVGAPTDTYEKTLKSIEFFKRCKIDVPRFGMLAPYKGTRLREWVKKNAKMLVEDDDFTHGLEYTDVVVPYETSDFSAEDRRRAYEHATEEAEVWTVRMRFGRLAGSVARVKPIRKALKKLYYSSNWIKRRMWR